MAEEVIADKIYCPVIKKTVKYPTYSGTEAVSLGAGASADYTITHDAIDVAGSPNVSIDNANITLEVKNLTDSGFVVTATNTDGVNAQSGTLTWSRKGINLS